MDEEEEEEEEENVNVKQSKVNAIEDVSVRNLPSWVSERHPALCALYASRPAVCRTIRADDAARSSESAVCHRLSFSLSLSGQRRFCELSRGRKFLFRAPPPVARCVKNTYTRCFIRACIVWRGIAGRCVA